MKTVFKAYCLAGIGLLFGVVGLHRFYLGFFNTGGLMALLFFSGVCCSAIGYAHTLAPFLQTLSENGGNIAALPAQELLDLTHKTWFVAGFALSAASLCWLAVDCLFMTDLARKANQM